MSKLKNHSDLINKEIKDRKEKYLKELQNQINEKNKALEVKIKKIKDEQLIKKQSNKEREELKSLIKAKLKKKYQDIIEETKKFDKYTFHKNSWKINRENINKNRNKILSIIYDDKITYDNIFSNENTKTSPFVLSNYLSFYLTDFRSLLIQNNVNNQNSNIFKIVNYHLLNSNNDHEIRNSNKTQIIKEMLIDKELDKLDFEEKENKLYKGSNILIQDKDHQDVKMNRFDDDENKRNKKDNNEIPKEQTNNIELIITDDNTKIINNNNYENELMITYFIKSKFVLPLIDKAISISCKEIEKLNKINLKDKKEQLENKNVKENKIIISMEEKKKGNLSISEEVFEMVNSIEFAMKKGINQKENNFINKHNKTNNYFIEIPIQVILQEFFFDVILNQYKIINLCFKNMLVHRYEIKSHIKICSYVFLHKSSDIIDTFVENIIDFKTLTLQSNDPKFLKEMLGREISKKLKNNSLMFIDDNLIINSFNFYYYKNFELRFALTNIEYAFNLFYTIPPPISFCFSKEVNILYDEIFKKLLKWKIYQKLFNKIFLVLKDYNNKKIENAFHMQIWIILHRAFNIINSINNFIFYEVKILNFMILLNLDYK